MNNLLFDNPIEVGMFKIHPKVPECMSDEAKAFIMKCFVPEPDDRASSAELLSDPYLRPSHRKRAKAPQESEPVDHVSAGEAPARFRHRTLSLARS